MTNVKVNRRTKGEQTKKKILEATIEVIAEVGIKGATHRAIAQKAGIQLSLTTYYFVDIKELVMEAMLLSSERFIETGRDTLREMFALFDSYDAATFRKVSTKEYLCEKVSEMVTNYYIDLMKNHRSALTVQQIFFTELMYTPELKALAENHETLIFDSFLNLTKYFNKVDPEIDAEIAILVLTKMEYAYLNCPIDEVDFDHIQRLVKRQIGYMMGLKKQ